MAYSNGPFCKKATARIVLSGEKLPMERGRVLRRPHFLSNANTALRFLAGKRIKLVNINAADLVDGRPAVVLGLIWTIILYFQIEENSRALEYLGGSRCASAMSHESGAATPTHRAEDRWKQGAKKTLLQWVANALPKDANIQVNDFGPSWRDGIAFLAIIDAIKANLINLAEMKRKTNRQRLETAFDVAESELGIARLLDAEDVDVEKPDERSIMTYVAQFLHKYPEPKTTGPDAVAAVQEEYENLRIWLTERVTTVQRQYDARTLSRNYEDYVRAERERLAREPVYQKLEKLMYTQSLVAIAPKSWRELVSLWIELERLHRRWLWLLDSDLPGDFRHVGEWLARAEYLLYFDEIPTSLDERTAAIISEKLEEHTSFFAGLPEVLDRFEAALRSPDASRIPAERLQDMKERLETVNKRAPQRKARLKYLEHKCCIVAFTELTKAKLAAWTGKYGRADHARALLDDYDNFVTKNKIFQEFDRAYVDIKQVVDEYKRVCEVDRTEAREIDSFLREVSETWRRVASDVRCARSVLEEVIAHWDRWNALSDDFTTWLDKAQHMLRVSEDERLEFFQDLTVWKERHQLLGDAAGFLAATCSEDISQEVKRKYVEITERWERVWEEAERYVRGGDALRHRRELAHGVQALDSWLNAADNLLSMQPQATTQDIQAYIDQLLQLNSEIEHHEELFKSISRTFQNAIAELPRDEVEANMAKLKQQKEALVRVRATVPVKLHQYRQLLVQHESLESGQKEISQWLDKAEETLQGSYETRREVIEERYEIHRSFFSRTTYYRSMLESKNKVFQSIVRAADQQRSADVTPQLHHMQQLNERFAHVTSEATRREAELQRLVRAWEEFETKKRAVEEWASRAEALLADNRVDSKQAVDFHKRFFQGADERAVAELVRSGRELLELVSEEDRPRIVQTVEELQRKWRELLDRAPPHLMRLEFRLDEAVFHHCIKDIEKEIVYEEQAYNQSDDADGILIRNEEYFRSQGKVMQVEHCLQNLHKIATSYTHQTNDTSLEEELRKCEQQWESTVHRVENFRQQLQRIPAKWDAYKEKYKEMEKWMDHVDKTMDSIVREVDSAEAFEREKTIFQNICREADRKREDMKWLVQTLDMLTNHCSEHEAQDEQIKLESLISRYKNLIPTIEITMIKTETYTRCYTYRREVHEVICILESAKEQAMVEPEPQSLQHVEQLVLEQQVAVQKLDRHRPSVMSMLQRGKDLIKDANAPAFVREDVRNLETGWNTAYETSTDRLHKLRDTQKVWSNYEYQKDELLSDLDKIESYVAHPGLELGVTNIGRELQETKMVSQDLEKAKTERLPQLQSAYAELQQLTANKPKPVIEKDLQTIEHKLDRVQDEVQTKVTHLEKFNEEWMKIEHKLEHVREWIKKDSPALVAQIQADNITPEERVEKSQALQKIISEKLGIIRGVAEQGSKLAMEHRVQDANRLKGEVQLLEKMMADLQRSTEHQTKVVEHDLVSWQKYQKGVAEIKPWIEEAEIKLGNVPKPSTLPEAQQLQQQSKALLTDCDKQLMNLQILSSVSHQLSGKTSAPDEVDAIHSRWAVVHDQADQWNNKLEKLVTNWENFEREAEKLESWIENGEKLLSARSVSIDSPQVEKLDRELNKLKSFGNEISQQQAKIISLSQTCDNICHNIQPEGANILKNKVSDIKQRTNALAETVRSRVNELSDKIIVRQEFMTKLHTFDNWITDFRRKTESYDQISADKVEPALQSMHVLLQEHAAKEPEFTDIYNEIKNMTLASHPDESRQLSETYSNIAQHYTAIESNIQQNKGVLQKWADLLNWYDDTKQQLGHIQYQIDGPKLTPESYESLRQELVNIITKVPEWKSNVALLDGPQRIKVTDQNTGRIMSPTSLVKEIETKAEQLLNQVTTKRDLVQKVGARWDKFNLQHNAVGEVLHNVQSMLNEMAQKPVPLTEATIQDMTEQLDRIDQELKEKQVVRKELREEGLHLMREDQPNMGTIQNALASADNNWDQVVNSVRDAKNKYILLSSTLQELKNFTVAFDREMARAEQLYNDCKDAPNDYVQTAQALDKSKKAYEILKRSKGLLDQMDVIKQSVLKQASTLGGFDTTPLEDAFLTSQTHWEKVNDAIIKRIQDLESQLIVWRQIDDTKNQVVAWLSETGQNLANACDNLEIRFGQNHLAKYKEELPLYLGLKNSITAKCEQITNLNKNIPVGQVNSIIEYLDNEFDALQQLASNLEGAVSSLESKENKLKDKIKRLSDSVSKIRDEIIQCDDMTGDNAKILDRLKKCQACKVELQNLNDEIDNLIEDVSEMNANYPGFYESLVPKELSSLQKRFESVLIHANKTETTLLTFLQKLFTDKLAMFNRNLKILDDKTRWCMPDVNSDKYNLEVKHAALNDVEAGIAECQQKVVELKEACDILRVVAEPASAQEAAVQTEKAKKNLDVLNANYQEIKNRLKENIDAWQEYETLLETVSEWLKEKENKVRLEATNLLNLNEIDAKINEIEQLNKEVKDYDTEVNKLTAVGENILARNPDSRVLQYINHLMTRYQAVEKFMDGHLNRLKDLKDNKGKYNKSIAEFKTWLQDANGKITDLAAMSKSLKPTTADLEQVKKMNDNKEIGQRLLNNAVESGEALFSGITPESREEIRNELRSLRGYFEDSVDSLNNVIKDIETTINKRSSFDDTFNQVQKWISDKEGELGDFKLCPTLPEKKAQLHANKILHQEVELHQSIISQLTEKIKLVPDEDAEKSLSKTIDRYRNMGKELAKRVSTCESHVADHETYVQMYEDVRDRLNHIVAENSLLSYGSITQKEDVDSKIAAIEKVLTKASNIDSDLAALKSHLENVLQSTSSNGHPLLISEYEQLKATWDQFATQCKEQDKKLKDTLKQWTESQKTLDELEEWLKIKENQVRDQSLKSTLEAKIAHLNKVKEIQGELASRAADFAALTDTKQPVSSDSDLSGKTSKLATRYHTLNNLVNEIISKYEVFVAEHQEFENDYNDMEKWLNNMLGELQDLNEIVGDYAVLQEKQNKAKELYETRNKKTPAFEEFLGLGEKLYTHTSPDGREVIRQKIRKIRTLWDSFGDSFQETVNKLDQCLLQFSDFSLAQEQLTKWLKDVERAMQRHTELKASLEEKKAQLQNHKIMHQEIMSHQQLVESVCDKAQQLVDQTHDASLNVYLQSIKQLFQNIVTKSQNLSDNLEDCVKRHEDLVRLIQQYKEWLGSQSEKLHDIENAVGEKPEIIRKLQSAVAMKDIEKIGSAKLDEIRSVFSSVSKSTSEAGNAVIKAEIDNLHEQLRNAVENISSSEQKLKHTLEIWNKFDSSIESITEWLKDMESKCRDQSLCSTLQEKEAQLQRYVNLRNEINAKEKEIDAFVDESHSLIQLSGVERLKPLVTQISSRYQQLHLISKEIVNHWSELVADHKKYVQLSNEFDAWLKPLEEQLSQMVTKEDKLSIESKGSKLQVFLLERDNGEHKIGILTAAGDKVLPETAANGRENIRSEIRTLRERWDKLNDTILQQQKEFESQTLQWSSYQDVLQQTLSWLDDKEKIVDSEDKAVLNSAQEIKSKLLKNKTLLQEIYSHKRVIETVTEKAKSVAASLHSGKGESDEMNKIIQSVWDRYNALTSKLSAVIDKHESTFDIYQQFSEQQKSLQDYQKQLWDRLHLLSDFSGNKAALQSKLAKIQELLDAIPNGNNKLKILSDLIESNAAKLSPRGKEGMSRELALLKADLEKFTATVHDVKRGIEDKIQQWIEFDSANDRLQHWLSDTEMSLKTYTPKATLDEKVDQLNKYQDLCKSIDYHENDLTAVKKLGDTLDQAILANLKKTENDVDKLTDEFSDLIENCNDTRITMNLQQMTSRFQSVQSTAKELVKKCEQAVNDHQAYQEKYNQCTDWIKSAQHQFQECQKNVANTPEGINAKRQTLNDLLSQRRNATLLVNNTIELGEKLYPSTSPEGKDLIEQQLHEIQQALDYLFDNITKAERDLDSELNKWSSFEDNLKSVQQWLTLAEKNLPKEIELKATLDEKRNQLNVYRTFLQDAIAHQQDIADLEGRAQTLPDGNKTISKEIDQLKQRHETILKRAKSFVEQYEAIVNNHQQYTKAVMDLQEWVEATHNTAELWGDVNLERVSLSSNCEKLKTLQHSLPEEKNRIDKIRSLGEKVLPGTISNGQANIRNQIDSSHQEWEGLVSFINKTIEALENKIQQWNEYENMKDQCLAWIRNTDTQIHAVDLKATLPEKQEQFKKFQELQGEVRAKELEIDNITEKAQNLYTGVLGPRGAQISDLAVKYQTLSQKVKDLTNRWQQYVKTHQEFSSNVTECSQWIEELRDKLDYCADLSSCSQDDLETKLVLIQNLLLAKDEGFTKVQSLVELAQNVMANTAPAGHEAINNALIALQEQWSALLSRMIETKNMLDDSVTKWAGFLEQIQLIDKSNSYLETMLAQLSPYESTMSDKRAQLEKLKEVEEKARCDRIDVDQLRAKAAEMLASGQQNQAASKAQETLNKFDSLYDKIKKLLADREEQYKDHRLYKEAHDELIQWLGRAREKVPSLKSKPLGDKLAIENSVAPLEALINKQAQGELLLEHLQHTGEVVLASTSPDGQVIIKNELKALKESFDALFNEIRQQKNQLEATVSQWRDYKDEYERLSDWLQQKEILIKNHKLNLLGTAKEKGAQVNEVKEIVDQLNKGKADIDNFNASAAGLLSSHLDTYVNNQLRHLNSRYQVLVNMAADVLKKVETNYEQHQSYDDNYAKTKKWIDDAWDITRSGSEAGSNSSKEALQKRLEQIEDLLKRRDEGQNLVHATVNAGEKVLRNTRSDGKDKINTELKELQNEWDRLVKKMTTAKVHLETAMLQWADYSSSYSQLQQWISDREAKLQEVCDQKVAKSKKGQDRLAGLTAGLGLGERKATLRQTNNIVQDIVSFEPMIQSVTSKASELMQQAPASEITTKYETLSKQAKDLYEKQKETVEQHQAFIDAGTDFVQWIRAARERLSKCSDATGDKESLSSKISQLKVLESELPEGQAKLQKALEQGELSCSKADDEDREEIEEEIALMQEEYDSYVEQLSNTKALIEGGIVKWTEYEEHYKEALDWLSKTEKLVQSFNKLQNSLEQKKVVLEEFQGHLQTLFDWQTELDKLNVRAQTLLETCSDTRISNGITQMTTKYNALLSLAKEVMKRLEVHYQEHQQHNALYGECQDWLDRTRDKLNQCAEIPNTLAEVNSKLNTVKLLRQSLEQGQNKLRYLLELKEKVIMNTEQQGAAKIQEDTDSLKQEFDRLIADLQDIRNKLTNRASQFDDISKIHKLLVEWLDDIDNKIQSDDSLLNDLSEKKAKLEKFKTFNRDIDSHSDLVKKLNEKLKEDGSLKSKEIEDTLKRYDDIKKTVNDMIAKLEEYVKSHIQYKESYDNFYEWIRNCKIEIQQCSDSHGEKEDVQKKLTSVNNIIASLPKGEALLNKAVKLSEAVLETTGIEGKDNINQEIKQLKIEWENLQQICKDTKKLLEKCLSAWSDFLETHGKMDKWVKDFDNKLKTVQKVDKITPEHLEKCRELLAEALGNKHVLEELNDRCENLMELSACAWVRDKTVNLQTEYTTLLTKIQGLVSNGEKNLSDHTEFIKAKEELQKWLETAHGTVHDSVGVGDIDTTKDKLETIKLVSNRMTEGHHLLVVLQEAFKKALNNTPPEEQDGLRNDVKVLQESWDQLKIDLNSITAQLKAAIGKWEDFEDSKNRMNQWIKDTEQNLDKVPPTGGEFGEMKTLLEKYKHIEEEIDKKIPELERLKGEAAELSSWAKKPAVKEAVTEIEKKINGLRAKCAAKKAELESEMKDYNQYHQSLQDTEKWLLQISFQLMAHNSLYISNREQTEEQLAQHAVLLDDIQKYRSTLDDLEAKGRAQIERYQKTTPSIKDTVGKQLKNVNDSHKSLLATALQIERRLREGLAKFKEYEDTLESILENLDECEPAITELDVPVDGLAHGRELLDKARALHNRLQTEKGRLSAAVAACSAAAASVSRPSSPADTAPLPIPPRELFVRARLEDLIDQVQSHLETLGDAVHSMEESMKQVLEIQEWINVHNALARDWLTNPSKLRPEAAKQDMAAMNDALASVSEKRNRLLTEIPTDGLEDEIDLEEELNNLEEAILKAIEREKGNQGTIDDFRHKCQEIHDWFDSVLKKMCLADKGSGLPCLQKLSALKELSEEFAKAGKDKVDNIKAVGSKVINIVSNLESQQVEEQMKSVERRYNDIAKRIQRKLQMLEITHKAIDGTKSEVNAQNEWMQKEIDNILHPEPLGYESKSVKERQKKMANLLKDTDGKKTVIDSLEKKVSNIQSELEPSEQMQLESELSELASKQKQLASLIKQEIERLSGCTEDRKKLENDIEKAKNWLKAKLAEIKKLGGPVPLEAAKIEKDIAVHKKHQGELSDFHNDTLTEVMRTGNAVSKDCSPEDRAKLQAVLEDLNKQYTSAKVDIDDKLAALTKLVQGRNDFESEVAKVQSWLNEAEVAATPELRTTSLQLLEEQLAKFEKLSKEAEDVEKNINKIKDKSKDIMDSLSDSNKLQLKEQVNILSDRFARINAIINDKKAILQKHIKEYKDAAAKIAAALEFLNEIQNKLKALNKPIGSRVEDVQPIIQAYESILADLKKNKKMLNELQGGNLHDLQDILAKQDDLMSTIEDQISKLKSLLLLREQFFALVKEIEEFIAKYTDLTSEIEKSSDTLEEKIKRYDDIILKIQGCEALLATATDKGQQIAAEGTVIDRNNITELLQSLKQQLLTLRRLVESKRQEHEKAAAEHKKLASDLSEILQWLHDNESAVHSRPLLNRDVASVDKKLIEHATLVKTIQANLDKLNKITDMVKSDDGVPGSLQDMVSEANSLKTSLPAELANREKYLQDNKKWRQQYQQLVEKLNIWVNEATIRLDMGKNGTDFENIESDLEEHKSFFNTSEPDMKDLVGKRMQDIVDKIWPSLAAGEQEELSKEHQKHNQLLKNTLNSAKSRQAQLEQDLEIWKDFCQLVDKIKAILDKNDIKEEPITSVDVLRVHLEKIKHAKNDLENQQALLDVLRERARELCSGADAASGERVEQKTRELADRWGTACEDLAQRAATADHQLSRWTQLLDIQRSLGASITAASDRLRQLDATPSTRRRALDTRHALQELQTEVSGLEDTRDELLEHAEFVLGLLGQCKEAAADTDKAAKDVVTAYDKLRETIAARLAEIDEIVSEFDRVSEKIDELRQQIEVCIAKVKTFYVFGEDETDSVRALAKEVSDLVERTKTFTEESRKRYGGSAPADVAQELSALELSSEALAAAMEEKEREWKRARTARTDYAADVEHVQAWIRAAELTARDRTLPPEPYRERLVATRQEVPNIADRVERLTRNARAIVEGSRDAGERQLVQSTVTALSEQFASICSELEARQAAVEDACDAVARFLGLLEKVLLWVETQRAFLARPLPLADLQEAQQKQTEYGNALKSCKQQAKNLADMTKEIEAIERVTSPGDLPARLEAAENATVDVEKKLAKTNGLLQELAEEWERCEKKLKDVGHWLEATARTLEAPQSAKKPLRDRLAIREKIINDISTQKTKISYAVEKLNVHFGPDGVAAQSRGPEAVEAAAKELTASLDALGSQTSGQATQLAAALAQVEAYCADVARLRAQLLEAEQQLRQAAQPNYSPRDPDHAQSQQQACRERTKSLQSKIQARNERIKLLVQRGSPDADPLRDS
ncbi:spectrin repeat domain-containing protein [Phthorimaea operculella]|nr:spectrin repeat domain-containing protein [Phthorimaea operculella]